MNFDKILYSIFKVEMEKTMIFKSLSLTLASLVMFFSVTAHAQQIVSDNDVGFIDGGTLTIKGEALVLYAIKAPALGSYCNPRLKKYDCGLISKSSLMDMSAGAKITCSPAPAPHNKKYKCLSNGYDLSEGMVYTGWATPLETAPDLFKKLAREAKQKRRGMWRILTQ